MKKLVSVLVLGSLVSSVYAWTDASVNYYQPIAAYEALKEADTNSSKNTDLVSKNKVQNDFKVITNIESAPCADKGAHKKHRDDVGEFKDIMSNNALYQLLATDIVISPESLNHAEFVMLMREMHRINHNLEMILAQKKEKGEERRSSKMIEKYSDDEISEYLKDGLKNGFENARASRAHQKKLVRTLEDASRQGGDMDG